MDLLNELFGVEGRVSVTPGRANLPKINLSLDSENTAEVYLNGAHVTSWRSKGREVLFLSENSKFQEANPIRGGIPLVFPQFGPGSLPQHGFARTSTWSLASTRLLDSGELEAVFVLRDTELSREIWNHSFRMDFLVTLGSRLSMELRVQNTGSEAFDFTVAFHTYFSISDIKNVKIDGLEGIDYLDSLKKRERFTETGKGVRFAGEVDRIYLKTPRVLSVVDEGTGRTVQQQKIGFPDAVVWNPWIEKAKKMQDFGDDEYLRMVCLEAGYIGESLRLRPQESWEGRQNLVVG
jgi:glucose-6-phosphate 1-epimerase